MADQVQSWIVKPKAARNGSRMLFLGVRGLTVTDVKFCYDVLLRVVASDGNTFQPRWTQSRNRRKTLRNIEKNVMLRSDKESSIIEKPR